MGYLVDTHVFLWWLNGDARLRPRIVGILENPAHTVFVSVGSLWELSIKISMKKLTVDQPLETLVTKSEFRVLPVTAVHIYRMHRLPYLHRDPFDRILIAQSQEEMLTLVTADEKIRLYKLNILRA